MAHGKKNFSDRGQKYILFVLKIVVIREKPFDYLRSGFISVVEPGQSNDSLSARRDEVHVLMIMINDNDNNTINVNVIVRNR